MLQRLQSIIDFLYGDTHSEQELRLYESIGCEGLRDEQPWDLAVIYVGTVFYFLICFVLSSRLPFLIPLMLFGYFIIYTMLQDDIDRLKRNNHKMRLHTEKLEREIARLDHEGQQ